MATPSSTILKSTPVSSRQDELSDLHAFSAFVSEKLQQNAPYPSPEEVVDEWYLRNADDSLDDDEDFAAIKASVEGM